MNKFPSKLKRELTSQEREALILTRKKVLKDRVVYPHICVRLSRVGDENPHLVDAVASLKMYIRKQLGVSTLESWQGAHGIPYEDRDHRANRLAWIDWMLYNTSTE